MKVKDVIVAICITLSIALTSHAHSPHEFWKTLGRWTGYGYSDGYHNCPGPQVCKSPCGAHFPFGPSCGSYRVVGSASSCDEGYATGSFASAKPRVRGLGSKFTNDRLPSRRIVSKGNAASPKPTTRLWFER